MNEWVDKWMNGQMNEFYELLAFPNWENYLDNGRQLEARVLSQRIDIRTKKSAAVYMKVSN